MLLQSLLHKKWGSIIFFIKLNKNALKTEQQNYSKNRNILECDVLYMYVCWNHLVNMISFQNIPGQYKLKTVCKWSIFNTDWFRSHYTEKASVLRFKEAATSRFTFLFIIPRIVLLSSIQPKAETLDLSTHALPRNLLKIFPPHEHEQWQHCQAIW